jgi:cobalamin biosynthesis protein CobT
MASKGLSGAAPVLEGYGLSCEHDLSLLVQEDLNTLSSQLKPFHSRILRTWVQGLAAEDPHHKRDKKRAAGNVNDAPAAKKHSNTPPSAEIKEQEGTKHIAKEDEDEDEKEEDEDKDDTGDEDEDEDEDEDSDEGDEEASCGAAGEQEGVGDGKSAADVLIVGEEKAQHHNEDGKRASEGVNDVPAVTQAKTTTLSTEQQSFVLKFMPAAATIDKKRKITST